jgi:hypothetical protein
VCDTQDWQVQAYPDAKNVVERRAQDVIPAATEKKKKKTEKENVEVTPDLRPMLPTTTLPEEEDWLLIHEPEAHTPRCVPGTEGQWVAVDPPSYLEMALQGKTSGAFPESPKSKSLNDREVGLWRTKTVTFQLECTEETTTTADEKDLRWEDGLERRKGIKKEKGQRAERLARDTKKEKASSTSNSRKA